MRELPAETRLYARWENVPRERLLPRPRARPPLRAALGVLRALRGRPPGG